MKIARSVLRGRGCSNAPPLPGDAANNPTSLVEPGGSSGCAISPRNLTTLCTAFAYNANGQRTGTQFPGGASVTVTYDSAGNQTAITGTANAGTVLSRFSYCYQVLNGGGACPTTGPVTDTAKITQVIKGPDQIVGSSASTTDYNYDDSGRLCRAMSTAATTCPTTPPASGNAYGYDGAGNRQWSVIGSATSYYGYNADNEICWSKATTSNPGTSCSPPTGSTAYSFDNAGNLTATSTPASSFAYNTLAQTTSITENGASISAMTYRDVGQAERTSLTVSGATTNFLNSPLGLDSSTTGMSTTYIVRDPAGNPIGFKDGSNAHWYYLPDGQGSIVGLINNDGSTLTDKYIYDEFGRMTTVVTSTAQPLGFVAGIMDSTSLVKFGTRYYDPNLGRWTQQDPMTGLIGTQAVNRYEYAGCDAVNSVDPMGTFSWGKVGLNCLVGAGFGAVVGGLVTGAVAALPASVAPILGTGLGFFSGFIAGFALGAISGCLTGAVTSVFQQISKPPVL